MSVPPSGLSALFHVTMLKLNLLLESVVTSIWNKITQATTKYITESIILEGEIIGQVHTGTWVHISGATYIICMYILLTYIS